LFFLLAFYLPTSDRNALLSFLFSECDFLCKRIGQLFRHHLDAELLHHSPFICSGLTWITFSSPFRSILLRDLRSGSDKATIAVNYHEVTVGNPDGPRIHPDEDVHPVVIFPHLSDLYITQVGWLTKGVDYLFSD